MVYAALGGAFFLLPIELQQVPGYSPLAAGAALLPTTADDAAALSARWAGWRSGSVRALPMTVGPLIAAAGLLLLVRGDPGRSYFVGSCPAPLTLGLGLAITVAPMTATVLAAAPTGKAGLASAINNCVARTGGLLAVAMLPAASGLGEKSYLGRAVRRRLSRAAPSSPRRCAPSVACSRRSPWRARRRPLRTPADEDRSRVMWNDSVESPTICRISELRRSPYDQHVACRDMDLNETNLSWTTEQLVHGDPVEVYYWSRREWLIGTFELDANGDPFVSISARTRLRFQAAMLMGLRRILH